MDEENWVSKEPPPQNQQAQQAPQNQQGRNVSTFPPPPAYYRLYGQVRNGTKANWKPPKQPPRVPDLPIFVFGEPQHFTSHLSLPSLKENGCVQLYSIPTPQISSSSSSSLSDDDNNSSSNNNNT